MNFRLVFLPMLISLSISGNALAQICSVSEYPYGFVGEDYPRMHGSKFKDITADLPFIDETERKPRYSQFWINTDVLNVRTGPGFKYKTTSETYYGNLVFAFAKTGDWVAIGKGVTYDDIKIKPEWVHINYLSSNPIKEQVATEVLKKKCSFREYGESSAEKRLYDKQNNTSNACGAVTNYLTQQKLLSKTHNYYDEYFNWRSSQKDPENYESLPCDIRRYPPHMK